MKKINLIAIGLLLIGIVSADAGNVGFCGMMSDYGGFGIGLGWIMNILVIVALVLLIAWLVKQIQKK